MKSVRYLCKQCGESVTGNYAQAVHHKLRMHPTPIKPHKDYQRRYMGRSKAVQKELDEVNRTEEYLERRKNNGDFDLATRVLEGKATQEEINHILSTREDNYDSETEEELDNIGF